MQSVLRAMILAGVRRVAVAWNSQDEFHDTVCAGVSAEVADLSALRPGAAATNYTWGANATRAQLQVHHATAGPVCREGLHSLTHA